MLTLEQLKKIIPYAGPKAGVFIAPLNAAMDEFGISTPGRAAAFVAQIAHESGSLRYTRELASGAAYEGRADLGNTQPGDGVRFKGRGLIQITGRANYIKCSKALFGDENTLVDHPELLEEAGAACRSAAWFWCVHGLNDLADKGDFVTITKRINGGTNGLAERQQFWSVAKGVLGC